MSLQETRIAADFLKYVSGIPSQFHCVVQTVSLLKDAGFKEISEKSSTDFKSLKPGGKYYFTRNQSSIVAFAVGGKFEAGNGFIIQAAHTDSPVPKVKPVSKLTKQGYMMVACEMYGGGLWGTWFDRDLSLAGRVIVSTDDGKFDSRLVCIKKPVLRIPNLAIHLNREIYTKGFNPNKETEVVPMLATLIKSELEKPTSAEPAAKRSKTVAGAPEEKSDEDDHHPLLLSLLAEELDIDPGTIRDFELCLYDTQPPALNGAHDEFVCARGLDNLLMSFITARALIDSLPTLGDEKQVRMCALFDNEEIGSKSLAGAGSSMMQQVLERINGDADSLPGALRRSFLVSADMAHAVHPNYADKHEGKHRPAMHKGLVIKQNCNQRYATTSITKFLLTELAKRHGLPVQKFVVRNDVGCGSTIGPILASQTGIRTVDVGVAQLAMHSVRETCGTADINTAHQLLKAVYEEFGELDASLENAD